jgi:hypothetical protein
MSEEVGFGVAQTVEYGKPLETANDGKYAVCEKAVDHYAPEFERFLNEINSKPPKGTPEEWFEKVKNAAIATARGMALYAETWAMNNHPWKNKTGDAERGLTGYTIIDGVIKAIS